MRNYIILNGVNSNTITGLLISTLPPITKPKIRTQTEEIDGRDGDIVTKLGYSAYDKEFEIGLYGDFDINEVISYFNSEGTVVFSNEEDKYYNYQILDQIDYEKLIRFKTATIRMHVQPFKYPLEEEQIQVDATVVEAEGSNISLQYTNPNHTITSELKGDLYQNGTPTPDNPQEIEVVTGQQEILVEGKNLYDASKSINGYINNSGNISEADNNLLTDYIKVESGNTYTISVNTTFNNLGYALFNSNKDYVSRQNNNNQKNVSITIPNGISYIRVWFNLDSLTHLTPENILDYQPMIEKGSEATDYVEYHSQSYTIDLGTTELYGIPDTTYRDRIYKDNGTWYIEKQIGKTTINSFATKSGTSNNIMYSTDVISDIKRASSGTVVSNIISTHGVSKAPNTMYSNNTTGVGVNTNGTIAVGFGLSSSLTTLELVNNWASTNKIIVYYELATPTTEEITDTTLLGQLNELAEATTYENTTNISVTGSLPVILKATTSGMPNTVINNIGNIYAKPLITIYGSGNIGVYLNQIQVLQIDLGNNGSITIDVSKMEAYNNSTKALMNRLVTGDYMKFLINSGENNIAFSGNVAGFTMDNYTRWL